ncbi:MAG TPA: TadE family protein [Gemmataceae bacterium]|jgi:Flp pilus assembly protein TadG|nr:TadE family protein [Gemmataceae bacterium]
MRRQRLTSSDALADDDRRRERGAIHAPVQPKRDVRRRGATTVEAAVAFTVLFTCLFALIVGGLGVFRYFQVVCLARESARYLSVRGKNYATDTKNASPTEQQTFNQVVLPLAAGMNSKKLTLQADWIDRRTGATTDWDSATKSVVSYTSAGASVTDHVRVTVSYQWFPEAFLAGPYYLRSVTEVPMSY